MFWELEVIRTEEYKKFDYNYFTTLTRIKSVQNSWHLIRNHLVFGVGIGDVRDQLMRVYDSKSPDIPAHNQNYFLYIWLAAGLPALLSFVIFLWLWFRQILGSQSRFIKSFALSYGIFLVLILMLDALLKYHIGIFSTTLFLICVSALAHPE